MKNKKFYSVISVVATFIIFQFIFVFSAVAQDSNEMKPELSVAGIELGNRKSAENFLKEGYSPRVENDGRVSYYFYNKWATQVMRLSAPSIEDKYFITEIEVFRIGRSYQERHFHTEEIKYFSTESGVFIGFKQSAGYLIAGIKNAGATNEIKPKTLIKIQGEPTEKVETDKKYETLSYSFPNVKLNDEEESVNYEAEYEFYKDKLKRFKLTFASNKEKLAKK